jgi:hypothetical protein
MRCISATATAVVTRLLNVETRYLSTTLAVPHLCMKLSTNQIHHKDVPRMQ